MSAAELLLRVDVWIARRIKFPCDDDSPAALWGACSGSFGAASAPALGCLLELVREAWGKPKLYASPHGDGWRIKVKGPNPFDDCKWGDTEAEALVAALEAAP